MSDPARPQPSSSYDARLAQQVLEGGVDAVEHAMVLFERHDPPTLSQATALVRAHGAVPRDVFERIAQAYDVHRHLRDMPCD